MFSYAVNSQKTQAQADSFYKNQMREDKELRSKFSKNAGAGGQLWKE